MPDIPPETAVKIEADVTGIEVESELRNLIKVTLETSFAAVRIAGGGEPMGEVVGSVTLVGHREKLRSAGLLNMGAMVEVTVDVLDPERNRGQDG